jgi:hypothetical protein
MVAECLRTDCNVLSDKKKGVLELLGRFQILKNNRLFLLHVLIHQRACRHVRISREKCILPLSWQSVCPSVGRHVSARFALDVFPLSLIFGALIENCRENSNLFQIGQKYRRLYTKN